MLPCAPVAHVQGTDIGPWGMVDGAAEPPSFATLANRTLEVGAEPSGWGKWNAASSPASAMQSHNTHGHAPEGLQQDPHPCTTMQPSHTPPHPIIHILSQVVLAEPLDACVPLRGGSTAYAGKVVLAQRGGIEGRSACTFTEKALNVLAAKPAASECVGI